MTGPDLTQQEVDALLRDYQSRNGHGNGRLRFVAASAIKPESVRWLWDKRIPLGGITLCVGREGTGKSTLTAHLIAQVTTGRLQGELHGQPCDVILATLEDSLASVVVPRLIAAGADLERVHLVKLRGDEEGPLRIPDDLAEIADVATTTSAKLLVVDPLVATLPEEINAHRDQHVRRALSPMAALSEAAGLSSLPVIHFNKAAGSDALLRVGGSIGFVAAARSVLAFGLDPDDPEGEQGDQRILAHTKSNFGRKRKSIRCTILETDFDHDGERIETSRLELGEECDVRAAEFFTNSDPEERHKRAAAREWLAEHLSPEWEPSGWVNKAAEGAGHRWRTVQRAFGEMLTEGEADRKEEGFPKRSWWRLASGANAQKRPLKRPAA
jgi:RecA-family ATPase